MKVTRVLVTGEGPWTCVDGGRPGWYKGSHISEVRTLCVAQALQERGYAVDFLSSKGKEDNQGGFGFRCVGPDVDPLVYDVIVCHQSMFWYNRQDWMAKFRQHPALLMTGDLLPMGEGTRWESIRWVFFDAPGHTGAGRYLIQAPRASVNYGCFGVAKYDEQVCPYFTTMRPVVVYLGKVYPGGFCLDALNRIAERGEVELWFGGRVDGTYVGKTRDADLSDDERARLFHPDVHFVADYHDHQGPTTVMEAARFAQHADMGLVFDPHVRHATVSKVYFYLSHGLPMLMVGGCANEGHVSEVGAGTQITEAQAAGEGLHDAIRYELRQKRDRSEIKRRALLRWSYDQLVGAWIAEWEKAWEAE